MSSSIAAEEDARTAADARALTRRRREERVDAEVSLPFNVPHVEVECPECGETFEVTIATGDPVETSPSFGRCSSWECEAFLKFRHSGGRDAETGGQETLGRWSR